MEIIKYKFIKKKLDYIITDFLLNFVDNKQDVFNLVNSY